MRDINQDEIDELFQIIATRFESLGAVTLSKEDIKGKLIGILDKQVTKTIKDVRKALVKSVDDKVTDEDVGIILTAIIRLKVREDILSEKKR